MPACRPQLCPDLHGDDDLRKTAELPRHGRLGFHPGRLGYHGLRPDRRVLGRALPGPDPVHLHVPPYHLGNGEFGGFTPLIFFGIYAATGGNLYAALIWPIAVPIMTFLIGMKYLPETKDTKIWEEVTPTPASGAGASTPMGLGADTATMK